MKRALLLTASLTLVLLVARTLRRWFPVRVAGDSMRPTLEPGDLLAVRPVRAGEPSRGQVIVVRFADGGEIVKRVVDVVSPNTFWIEGDNRARSTDSRSTGPVAREDVSGIVVARYWPLERARSFRR